MSDFDHYARDYRRLVRDALAIPGVAPDFFETTKAFELGRRLPRGKRLRALDIGCGIATLHPFIAGMFAELIGVDVSAQSIAIARAANPQQRFEVYDGRHLPFADASFDFSFAVCVLHHVPRGQWPSFIREMARVVAPCGQVAVIEHNPRNPLTLRTVRRCPFDADAVLLTAGTMVALLREARLASPHIRFFPFLPLNGKLARLIDQGLAWLPLGAQYIASATVSG
jgi:SAM-dependent methyltransferase